MDVRPAPAARHKKTGLTLRYAGFCAVLVPSRFLVVTARGTSERQGFGKDGFLIVLGLRFGLIDKKHQVTQPGMT